MRRFPLGSQWRRWDLHVHTPFSALNNGFGNDFDAYAKQLLSKAIEKEIAVVGVTDYFGIQGYSLLYQLLRDPVRLRELVGAIQADKAQRILFLPNIELRTSVVVDGGRVNYHVILSDELEPETIQDHFLNVLRFTAESSPTGPDQELPVTNKNLEALGKRLKKQHGKFQNQSDLQVGMTHAVVAHESITKVLTEQGSRFSGQYLVVVPADEDLSKCSWDGQAHLIRKLLLQKASAFFSGNPATREFGLGLRHPSIDAFLEEFNTLKPCLHGSDAHDFEHMFEPDLERYNWLKADPTFNGLKQVLNEPDDRVFIGKVPELLQSIEARSTRLVKSLRISKNPTSTIQERWFDTALEFNESLVAIIGNKGNGKSALADIVALLGNTARFSSFSFLRSERFRDSRDNKAAEFQATLTWADETLEGPRALSEDPRPMAVEKVKYIPQHYLEEICNEVGLGTESRFYAELQDVIFSHVSEADQLGCSTLDELLGQRGDEVNRAIDLVKEELHLVNELLVGVEDRMKPEHRAGIEEQIAEKERELKAHDGQKPKEVKPPKGAPSTAAAAADEKSLRESRDKLGTIDGQLTELRERDIRLAKQEAAADRLNLRIANLQRQFDATIADASEDLTETGLSAGDLVELRVSLAPLNDKLAEIRAGRVQVAAAVNPEVKGSLGNLKSSILAEIAKMQDRVGSAERAYQEYLRELGDWEVIRKRIVGTDSDTGTLAYLKKQLASLATLPQRRADLRGEQEAKAREILAEKQRLKGFYEAYYKPVQQFLEHDPLASSESFKLTFEVSMAESGFADRFLSLINQRKVGPFAGLEEGRAEVRKMLAVVDWNSPQNVMEFASELLKTLSVSEDRELDVETQLLDRFGLEDLYNLIYSMDYLSPIYRLTWGGRGLEQLSPGERGNLLLVFYLLIDQHDIPLVIDQPEENLDNQTIVRTLVPCMKRAKKRRQIIMVTHNPNLAVVCDAEQVIYAQLDKEDGNRVIYETGSIEDPDMNNRIVDVLEGTRPAFDLRDAKYLARVSA
jgi:ABC-type lipoprotein export system ATPase subunit